LINKLINDNLNFSTQTYNVRDILILLKSLTNHGGYIDNSMGDSYSFINDIHYQIKWIGQLFEIMVSKNINKIIFFILS
jgi:hypothetical protein